MPAPRAPSRRAVADEALVRGLFHEHGRAMLAYATHLTRDRGTAEDVVQEALVRAWRNPDSLNDSKGSVRGWLLTVVRNIITDQIRARNRRAPEVPGAETDAAIEGDHAERVVDSVVVVNALSRLSEEHRAVLEQIYLLGSTVAEAAEVLRIPPGTVKSRSHYALRALRAAHADRLQPAERSAS